LSTLVAYGIHSLNYVTTYEIVNNNTKNGQKLKQKQCVTSKLDKQNEIPNKFNMTV